ncbi:hypothetical protein DFH28DRAFT_1125334 [Melampsora americana]|nr:hypothetical protein DFH28DRAFT_1125334 [Melampsora americana]
MDNTAKGTKCNTIINHTPPASDASFPCPHPPQDNLIYLNQAALKAYVNSYAAAHGFIISTLDTQKNSVIYKCHLGFHRHLSKAKKEKQSKTEQSTNHPHWIHNLQSSDWVYLEIKNHTHDHATITSAPTTQPVILPTQTQVQIPQSSQPAYLSNCYTELLDELKSAATLRPLQTTIPTLSITTLAPNKLSTDLNSIQQTSPDPHLSPLDEFVTPHSLSTFQPPATVARPTQPQCKDVAASQSKDVAAPQSGVAGKPNEELDEALFEAVNEPNIDKLMADEHPTDQEPPFSNLPSLDLNEETIPPIKSSKIKGDKDDKEVQPQIQVDSAPTPSPVLPPQKALAPIKRGCKVPKKGTKCKLPKGWVDIDKVHNKVGRSNVKQPIEASDPTHDKRDHQPITRSRKREEIPDPALQQRLSTRLKVVVAQVSAEPVPSTLTGNNPVQPAASGTKEIDETIPLTLTGNEPLQPAMTKHQKRRLAKKEVTTNVPKDGLCAFSLVAVSLGRSWKQGPAVQTQMAKHPHSTYDFYAENIPKISLDYDAKCIAQILDAKDPTPGPDDWFPMPVGGYIIANTYHQPVIFTALPMQPPP